MMKASSQKKAAGPEMIAEIYGVPVGTLANLRSQGRGPRFYRRGRRVIYFFADVEKWLTSQPCQTLESINQS
jgi:hypothetical protein